MPKAKQIDTETMLKMMEQMRKQLEAKPVPPPEKKEKIPKKEVEMLLELARASLKEYGTILPPKEALYTVLEAECPHCDRKGNVATEFGFKKRPSDGKVVPQSWCRRCRSGIDAHPTRRGGGGR